jgi:WD40 repeat protein
LWEVATHEQVATLPDNEWTVTELAFSPDGSLLAVASWYEYSNIPCKVHLWDVARKKRFADFTGHSKSVTGVAFSPDGKLLASCSWDNTVKVWDVRQHTLLATLDGHTDKPLCVLFSHQSPRLFSGDAGGEVLIWDLVTQQPVGSIRGQPGAIGQLVLTPDDEILVSHSHPTRDRPGEQIRVFRALRTDKLTRESKLRPLVQSIPGK